MDSGKNSVSDAKKGWVSSMGMISILKVAIDLETQQDWSSVRGTKIPEGYCP